MLCFVYVFMCFYVSSVLFYCCFMTCLLLHVFVCFICLCVFVCVLLFLLCGVCFVCFMFYFYSYVFCCFSNRVEGPGRFEAIWKACRISSVIPSSQTDLLVPSYVTQ